MAQMNAERRAVIEWFKNEFSREAIATTKTSRLQDGSLSYRFSVTNSSGINFDEFSFKVKVVDRDSGMEIGTASINAGEWLRGDRKNFKSRLPIPSNVRNLSFIMFAESVRYSTKSDSLTEAMRDMGDMFGKAGEGMGEVFGELFGTGGMPGGEAATVTKTKTTYINEDGVKTTQTTTTTRGSAAAAKKTVSSTNTASTARTATSSAQGTVGRVAQSYTARKNEKRLNKMRLGRSGWIVAGVSIGVLLALAALGSDPGSMDQIMIGGFSLATFLVTLIGKLSLNAKAKRIRTYETRINKNGNTSIDDIASYVGRPFMKVADDLHQMIVDGFFPEAYVDVENRMLVMTQNGVPIEDVAKSAAINKKAKRKAAREEGVVPETLEDLITMTDDSEIKNKLKALRTITKKIDARVEQVPELEKQVTDYREKYYPEVVRLTDEYNEKIVDMGKYGEESAKAEVTQASDGSPVLNTNPNYLQEQAAEIKAQLISLIDSVTEASENLLERLHEDDIMDITTDIKMLQTTLASKGLLDSDFDLRVPSEIEK